MAQGKMPKAVAYPWTPPVPKPGLIPRQPTPCRNTTPSYTPSTMMEKPQTTTMPTLSSKMMRTTSASVTTTTAPAPRRPAAMTSVRVPLGKPPLVRSNSSQSQRLMPGVTFSLDAPTSPAQRLDSVIGLGDILCVKGTPDGLTRLGANGGFMGHVLLVVAPVQLVKRHSEQGVFWRDVWPAGNVDDLWVVSTMESCRQQEGLHETDYLIYADASGCIRLQGESTPGKLVRYDSAEPIEVWQSPSELRNQIRSDIVMDVLAAIRSNQASWSWSTAVRAFLFSADMPAQSDDSQDAALQALEACWNSAPICTSLVIVFWQRYLCQLAEEYNAGRRLDHGQPQIHALDWIYEWIPLKSDRSLPGDLLSTLHHCGWNVVSHLPQMSSSVYGGSFCQARRRDRLNTL